MTGNVCCFGEILLRLAPAEDWLTKSALPFFIGGAELNVAIALSNWQTPVQYISAAPNNYLTADIVASLGKKNVDCSQMILTGERLGIYYLPIGSELKNAGVVYDRNYSSFAGLQTGTILWNSILKHCAWLHISAISPALNMQVAAVCLEAAKAANAMGITVSIDLNYRSKLWQYGQHPHQVMPAIMQYCNVVMGNIWAVESLLGIPSPIQSSEGKTITTLLSEGRYNIQRLLDTYQNIQQVAYTFRLNDSYTGLLQNRLQSVHSATHKIITVADKVGSGDCFMAGLIYGLYNSLPMQKIIDFAAAAAVGKLQEAGDATSQQLSDVAKIMENPLSIYYR